MFIALRLQTQEILCSGLDRKIRITIEDSIEIHFHNLSFRIALSQTNGQQSLFTLHLQIAVLLQKELIFNQLLCHRTATLLRHTMLKIGHHSPRNPDLIETPLVQERIISAATGEVTSNIG